MKIWKRYSVGQSPKVAAHAVEWRRVLGLARSIGEAACVKMCKIWKLFRIKRSALEAAHAHLHDVRTYIYKWQNHFFKMKGGYRDGLKHQKGRNKGSLHSKVAQSYMTPSLYLCFIVFEQSLISNKDIGMVSCQLFFHLYNYSRIKVSLWAIWTSLWSLWLAYNKQ